MFVINIEILELSAFGIELEGSIEDIGNGIEQHGHCYSLEPMPDFSNNKTELGEPINKGNFVSVMGVRQNSLFMQHSYS